MKCFALLAPMLLAGCMSTAPVVPKWPDVPAEMLIACPDLKTVDGTNTELSKVLETVADNYKEYYTCKDKTEDWIFWYNEQKKNWQKLK